MGAFADLSEYVNRLTGGNSGTPDPLFWHKTGRETALGPITLVGGWLESMWQMIGSPSHGALPGAVAAPTNATAGSLQQGDPGGGRQKWLTGLSGVASVGLGGILVFDRLMHKGGLNATTTSAQTVQGADPPGVPITRYTNGEGNWLCVEIGAQIGATGTTITASYTDQGGTAAQTTIPLMFGNTTHREICRLMPLPLAQGDTGVRSCNTVTVLATTGTAGDFAVSIVHPLVFIPGPTTGVGGFRDLLAGLPGLVEILPGACLSLALYVSTTVATQEYQGTLQMVER